LPTNYPVALTAGLFDFEHSLDDSTVQAMFLKMSFNFQSTVTRDNHEPDDFAMEDVFDSLLAYTMYQFSNTPRNIVYSGSDITILKGFEATGYWAEPTYRVVIAPWSFYTFTALSGLTLLWSGGIFFWCATRPRLAPNMSLFPEIDFASKCVINDGGMQGSEVGALLRGLGNASSREITKQILGRSLFVGAMPKKGLARIVLTTEPCVDKLEAKKKYL